MDNVDKMATMVIIDVYAKNLKNVNNLLNWNRGKCIGSKVVAKTKYFWYV